MCKELLKTFAEFEQRATALLEDRKKNRIEKEGYFSPVLFRGHAKACWELRTTLERYSPKEYSMEDYFKVMRAIRPEVQSRTGKRWFLPGRYSPENDKVPRAPQGYSFMAHLRHHAFPSPLLDWTRSFYIAAFFAFQSPDGNDPNVAIYSFMEYVGSGKEGWAHRPTIVGVGPYVATDELHFKQQSQYTFCKRRLGDRYVYSNHEEAFQKRTDGEQDVLTKFIVPRTERTKVLDRLRVMNITAYSLFGGEESLLEDLAHQEIERT